MEEPAPLLWIEPATAVQPLKVAMEGAALGGFTKEMESDAILARTGIASNAADF